MKTNLYKQYLALQDQYAKLIYLAPSGDRATQIWSEELRETKDLMKRVDEAMQKALENVPAIK